MLCAENFSLIMQSQNSENEYMKTCNISESTQNKIKPLNRINASYISSNNSRMMTMKMFTYISCTIRMLQLFFSECLFRVRKYSYLNMFLFNYGKIFEYSTSNNIFNCSLQVNKFITKHFIINIFNQKN